MLKIQSNITKRNITNEKEEKKVYSNFELPQNDDIITIANRELDLFKGFLNNLIRMNQSALTNKISFAENLAFRLLGSIDWNKANFDEIKQFIDPFLNSKHLNLNHLIFKEHGHFLHLKQHEVHEAIHEWSHWRQKLNKLLIENPSLFQINEEIFDNKTNKQLIKQKMIKNEQKNQLNNFFNLFSMDERLKEVLTLYMIAKWSKDDSSLKFSTFFHYGIPRARLRKPAINEMNLSNNSSINSVNLSSAMSSLILSTSNSISSTSDNLLPLSPPLSSSSQVEDSLEINSFESNKTGFRYYTHKDKIPKKLQSVKNLRSNSNSSSNLKTNLVSKEIVKETALFNRDKLNEKKKSNYAIIDRNDLRLVKGGIVTNQNVYFPTK